ncbi:nucleotide pyrophosphohydrolase [Streptomyces sp. NPDC127084]|uniref:nucleotide pyrophosphohydrolase n=1 Tax=Streptomyces sp. NPDC127084 TaxID=3347133 RepID=UPI003648459E
MTELDVDTLRRRLVEFAAARDWGPYHTPKNLAVALTVEAAELVEIFQWLTPEESARVMEDPGKAHRVADEVADVLAYLLQFCEVLGIDPLTALAAKIDRNELRFPAAERSGAESSGGERVDRGSAEHDRHSTE